MTFETCIVRQKRSIDGPKPNNLYTLLLKTARSIRKVMQSSICLRLFTIFYLFKVLASLCPQGFFFKNNKSKKEPCPSGQAGLRQGG